MTVSLKWYSVLFFVSTVAILLGVPSSPAFGSPFSLGFLSIFKVKVTSPFGGSNIAFFGSLIWQIGSTPFVPFGFDSLSIRGCESIVDPFLFGLLV